MLEAALRDLVATQLSVLDAGLTLVEIEKYIPSDIGTRSFIDILARDNRQRWVLIELKRSDAAARQAIHEIYKYTEAVKKHLGARDDELRAIIVSTEWTELLVPFSRLIQDTSISVKGIKIAIDEATGQISKETVEPVHITSGRILSPWHEISLYTSEQRLFEGVNSYDECCRSKGLDDYVMVTMKAPDGFYDASVRATAQALNALHGEDREPSETELTDLSSRMDRLDYMIYFVPHLQSSDEYLEIIRLSGSPSYEEAKDFSSFMEGDELLCSLQSYAFDAPPNVDRDYFEIGYPAKFKNKLLEDEGWTVQAIHRRGAFARNELLTDETILREIEGEAGTSGQALKRSILLDDNAEFTQLVRDASKSLPNNPVWAEMIFSQLNEARKEFPDSSLDLSIFSPTTGMLTVYFAVATDDGAAYLPRYHLAISRGGSLQRIYFGELVPLNDKPVAPHAFVAILSKYYAGEIGNLAISMTWGGYDARDAEILEDLNLIYDSFRLDFKGKEKQFSRMRNGRWRDVDPIVPLNAFHEYILNNKALSRILYRKLSPRISAISDGSSSARQLDQLVDSEMEAKAIFYDSLPESCDVCGVPLKSDRYASDGQLRDSFAWANMCADCTIYYGSGIGWGSGQLYRQANHDRWQLVAGGAPADGEED